MREGAGTECGTRSHSAIDPPDETAYHVGLSREFEAGGDMRQWHGSHASPHRPQEDGALAQGRGCGAGGHTACWRTAAAENCLTFSPFRSSTCAVEEEG